MVVARRQDDRSQALASGLNHGLTHIRTAFDGFLYEFDPDHGVFDHHSCQRNHTEKRHESKTVSTGQQTKIAPTIASGTLARITRALEIELN